MTKRWLAAAAFAFLALRQAPARAQPQPPSADLEEARKHYARGVQLYEQGADAAALAELERAYQLAPNWKVLYELGVVELAVHDFAAALGHFEQYLDEGKDDVKPTRRQEVTGQIAQLRQQVATIDLTAPPGAAIKLDDVAVATAPLAKPLVVNPGHHRLGATKDGLAAESRAISVAGGDHVRVDLVIAPPAPAPPPPPAVIPEPPPSAPAPIAPPPSVQRESAPPRPPPYPLWVGWIATGALASGAIVTGVEALNANSSLTRAKTGGPSTVGTLSDLSSRARGFALASDIMTGATVVVFGVTLYFALRPPSHAAEPSASLGVRLALGRVSLEGTF